MDKIFPHHIYKFEVPNYQNLNKKLISEIYDLKGQKPYGMVRSNEGGWHSNITNTKFKEFQKIICNYYTQKILKTNKDIEVSSIWANVNGKNHYNSIHEHPRSHYSGVYYVKVPKNSGNLYLINYNTSLTHPFNYFDEGCADEIEYEAKEGDLYFFTGNLPHRVGKNLSDEDRISISWNFNFQNLIYKFKKEE